MPVSRAFSTYPAGSPTRDPPIRFPSQSFHRERRPTPKPLSASLKVPGRQHHFQVPMESGVCEEWRFSGNIQLKESCNRKCTLLSNFITFNYWLITTKLTFYIAWVGNMRCRDLWKLFDWRTRCSRKFIFFSNLTAVDYRPQPILQRL
jgi:hypothetical protein